MSSGMRQMMMMMDKSQGDQNTNLTLEINPNSTIIVKLNALRKKNLELAGFMAK